MERCLILLDPDTQTMGPNLRFEGAKLAHFVQCADQILFYENISK